MRRIIVKPQTHLAMDMFLFALPVTLALSALMQHAADNGHVRFMFHALHGLAGIALCITVSLHLLMHLPWIQAQLHRLFQS